MIYQKANRLRKKEAVLKIRGIYKYLKYVRFELPEKERRLLREIQRNEKYRAYVKVTVLLRLDLGETPQKIALFLGIDDGTVYRHLENYETSGLDKYLKPVHN